MRHYVMGIALICGGIASATPMARAQQAADSVKGARFFVTGDPAKPRPATPSQGLMLMGGGDWDKQAFAWFAKKAGYGHILILRASGDGEGGREMFATMAGVQSVSTILFTDRAASTDPRVLAAIAKADGIFLAGATRRNMSASGKGRRLPVRWTRMSRRASRSRAPAPASPCWAGRLTARWTAAASISFKALSDPLGDAVTLVGDFLHMPRLAHIITDTHFNERDRLGRLIAFVAKARATGDPTAIGLGVDEAGTLCVEANGQATFYGPANTHAWLVQPQGIPKLIPGRPLDWADIRITGIAPGERIDLNTMAVSKPAFVGMAKVVAGRLIDAPCRPAATGRWRSMAGQA
ncbi:hypothetical protein ACVOMT_10405 [Sphingomonas panni]